MRRRLLASTAAGTVLLASALATRGAERRGPCLRSLVPAYLSPQELARFVAGRALPQLLVLNPASGPGAAPSPDFRRAVAVARARGSKVLGYVATTWGARAPDDVERDVDRYRRWYAVDGVFFDEASTSPAALGHYAALTLHARAAGARIVVLNPGAVPAPGYFDLADVVVTFEGSYEAYRRRADTAAATDPARTAHLIYAATRAQALRTLADPAAGYVYATSGTLPHPWGVVPGYLAAEFAAQGACP